MTTPRSWGTRVRDRLGLLVPVLVAVFGVVVAVQDRDVWPAVGGVGFAAVVFLATGPLMRWMRRGEGPYATRGQADDDRETYVRLRHNGGNLHGR